MQAAARATCAAPRDLCLHVTHHHEPDGAHLLLMRSATADEARWWPALGHVSAHLASLAVTIAPLAHAARGTHHDGAADGVEPSTSKRGGSAVSMVAALDAGGAFASAASARFVLPYWREMRLAWPASLLATLSRLADKVRACSVPRCAVARSCTECCETHGWSVRYLRRRCEIDNHLPEGTAFAGAHKSAESQPWHRASRRRRQALGTANTTCCSCLCRRLHFSTPCQRMRLATRLWCQRQWQRRHGHQRSSRT